MLATAVGKCLDIVRCDAQYRGYRSWAGDPKHSGPIRIDHPQAALVRRIATSEPAGTGSVAAGKEKHPVTRRGDSQVGDVAARQDGLSSAAVGRGDADLVSIAGSYLGAVGGQIEDAPAPVVLIDLDHSPAVRVDQVNINLIAVAEDDSIAVGAEFWSRRRPVDAVAGQTGDLVIDQRAGDNGRRDGPGATQRDCQAGLHRIIAGDRERAIRRATRGGLEANG